MCRRLHLSELQEGAAWYRLCLTIPEIFINESNRRYMKKVFLWLLSSVCAVAAIAQTVTINVTGNRNKQITVDGTVYELDRTATNRAPIVIQGLATGQHRIEVLNGNPNNTMNDDNSSSTFYLRSGYDVDITIRNNGSLQIREKRISNAGLSGHPAQYKEPMSSTAFNRVLQSVKRQARQATKYRLVNAALTTIGNYFTSSQVESLISQINSQPSRVELLKAAYLRTTDAQNYASLFNLVNSESGRNELTAHVNSYNYGVNSNMGNASASSHNAYISPMSSSTFNAIYQAAQNQWQANLRMNYIADAFANPSNYFTSSQARQLILLVPAESDRLILAKTAYRGITDATNFTQVSNLLSSTASRNELAAYINSYRSGSTYSYRTPMTDANFNILYRDIEAEWLPGAELNAINQAFANTSNYFSTTQIRKLVQLVSAEVNRLELLKAGYRTVTDPANYSLLYDLLSSQSARNELASYINSYTGTGTTTPGTVYRTAMATATYDALYRDIANTWGLGAKMNALTNTFANTSYYFSSAQAARLIELVSSESNRLQLAKSALRQVVDPDVYYSTISPILSSASSRSELEVYIRNNR
jgi:hypothetical protein